MIEHDQCGVSAKFVNLCPRKRTTNTLLKLYTAILIKYICFTTVTRYHIDEILCPYAKLRGILSNQKESLKSWIIGQIHESQNNAS